MIIPAVLLLLALIVFACYSWYRGSHPSIFAWRNELKLSLVPARIWEEVISSISSRWEKYLSLFEEPPSEHRVRKSGMRFEWCLACKSMKLSVTDDRGWRRYYYTFDDMHNEPGLTIIELRWEKGRWSLSTASFRKLHRILEIPDVLDSLFAKLEEEKGKGEDEVAILSEAIQL